MRLKIGREWARAFTAIIGSVAALTGGSLPGQQPAAPPRWTLTPEIRIGSETAGPQYQFSDISTIAVDRDSSVYVVTPEPEIRQFDARGTFVRALGRRGQGPGEFTGLRYILWRGDTLFAMDGSGRATRFSRDGKVISVTPWQSDGLPPAFPAFGTALLPDGTTLGVPIAFQGLDVISGKVTTFHVLHATSAGKLLDTLIAVRFPRPSVVALASTWGQPFGDEDLWASTQGVARVVVVDRRVPAPGAAATFGVTVVGTSHDTIFSRRYPYTPRPITRAAVDSLIDSLNTNRSRWTTSTTLAQFREKTYVPASYPPVSQILLAIDGSVWLRREPAATSQWTIIGPDGRVVGSATTPANVNLLLITGELAWGVERDSSDVPSLVRYRIGR